MAGARAEPVRPTGVGRHSGSALALEVMGEAPLVLSVGRAVRAGLPTAARLSVLGRVPLANGLREGFVGSDLGRRLARTADALVLHGCAGDPGEESEPQVLELDGEGRARLHPAGELVGLPPAELPRRLEELLGPGSSLRVGPAGTSGVAFANLAAGGSSPSFVGRGGLGATFASLGLLAIHLRAEPVPARRLPELERALLASPRLAVRAGHGSLELGEHEAAATGGAPLPLERERLEALRGEAHEVHGCAGCPTPCGWVFETPGGRAGGRHNALRPLGRRLGLADPADALRLLGVCNRLGLDAREAGDGLELLGEGRGEVAHLAEILEGMVRGEGPGMVLRGGVRAAELTLGRSVERDELSAPRGPVELLARRMAARGPEPMRTFPFLLERPEALPTGLQEAARRPLEVAPTELARLVAWHEDLVLALDVTGFCAFSAAGLLTDGVLSLDELATWLGLAGATELLDLGRQVARLHWRTRGGGEGSPGELPASLRSAGEELAALRESRGESPSSSTPARVHRAEPDGAVPGPGKVTLRASQALERKLGKDLVLELELPASVASVLRAAAEARPSARRLLLTESGGPLPSIHRRGERLSSDSSVRAGDLLDLVLVIPGG